MSGYKYDEDLHHINRIQFSIFTNDDINDYSSVIKDPYGINWLGFIFLNKIRVMPTNEPSIEDNIIIIIVVGRPIQKPIIAIIFTSPMPMPSFLRIHKYILEVK